MATGPEPVDGAERRSYTDDRGDVWTFTRRRHVRRSDLETHIALVVRSPVQTRIVTCSRDEWETTRPDLGRLLARSVPAGGSRANASPAARPDQIAPQKPLF